MSRTNALIAVVSAVLISSLCGCTQEQYPEGRVEADLRFLADDLLEGRGTPSRGLDIAALYLESQLRAAGWEPGNDGSYLQPFEVSVFVTAEADYRVSINGSPIQRSEYLLLPFGLMPTQTPVEFDLVFAGHGVSLPEEGVDDFSDLEVAGKAVVALRGAPWELDPHLIFPPDHGVGKAVQVGSRNGAMLIYVSEDFSDAPPTELSAEAGLLWALASSGHVTQLVEDVHVSAFSGPCLVIGPAVFDRLLAEVAGGTYQELQERLTQGVSVAKNLPVSVRIEINAETTRRSTSNVIAILPGAGPVLRDEWVVLTAHYDHVGTYDVPPGEDGICNGADDNASGTAAVLEAARRLAAAGPMKRSVMVALLSGEDSGLLGSAYYAAHPLAPFSQIVVNINLDMVGRSGGTAQALSPGSISAFERAVAFGESAGLTIIPDQEPTSRFTYFIDSYHFARNDVPFVSVFTALHEDYHQPSDEAEKIRFGELEKIVEMLTGLAEHYAGGAERPAYERPEWFLTPAS
jgi:hypothetical protein